MKIKFLRNVTVDIIDDSNNTDYQTYGAGEVIEIDYIDKVSYNFSNVILVSGDVAIDVRNDCFEKVEVKPETKKESVMRHLNVTC